MNIDKIKERLKQLFEEGKTIKGTFPPKLYTNYDERNCKECIQWTKWISDCMIQFRIISRKIDCEKEKQILEQATKTVSINVNGITNPFYKIDEYTTEILESLKNTIEALNFLETDDNNSEKYEDFIDAIIKDTVIFLKGIDEDSSLKDHIRKSGEKDKTKTLKERHYRDYFRRQFKAKNYIAIAEYQNRKEKESDLVIFSINNVHQITISFKIWKRNFNKKPPIKQLLENMGSYEQKGIIFMINNGKKPIEKKIINDRILVNPLYISNTQKTIKVSDVEIITANFGSTQNKSRQIYFIICKNDNYR